MKAIQQRWGFKFANREFKFIKLTYLFIFLVHYIPVPLHGLVTELHLWQPTAFHWLKRLETRLHRCNPTQMDSFYRTVILICSASCNIVWMSVRFSSAWNMQTFQQTDITTTICIEYSHLICYAVLTDK